MREVTLHLWAKRYDRDVADVFAIQSEIAEQIVSQLRSKLSPQEKEAIEKNQRPILLLMICTSGQKSSSPLLITAHLGWRSCSRPFIF